jgi:hypothetical protein
MHLLLGAPFRLPQPERDMDGLHRLLHDGDASSSLLRFLLALMKENGLSCKAVIYRKGLSSWKEG